MPNIPRITTAQINSLFPSSSEQQAEEPEITENEYKFSSLDHIQSIDVSSLSNNDVLNNIQPSQCIRDFTSTPFLQLKTFAENQDPKFYKALLKLRRKQIKATDNSLPDLSPSVMKQEREATPSIQQILEQCAIAKSTLHALCHPNPLHANLMLMQVIVS